MKQSPDHELTLTDFLQESLWIEGIYRAPTRYELDAASAFIKSSCAPTVAQMCQLALTLEPRAFLRQYAGMNVVVGNHVPPPGGPHIIKELAVLLEAAPNLSPYVLHAEYETLHPFMDGNGRTGRLLWLWRMGGSAPYGFLHSWYYQTLQAAQSIRHQYEANPFWNPPQ